MKKAKDLSDSSNETNNQSKSLGELPILVQESKLPLDFWLHRMCSNMERMANDEEYRCLIAKHLA
ncbi:hypothetical protein Defa_15810 [Desulfovibrio sp. TH_2024_36128]|uniref:Uncharacterized protein n=1 Tax=Desulfovibrio falkowii TaxID=3136602 RepID=A0ABQ0E8H7_9BACT